MVLFLLEHDLQLVEAQNWRFSLMALDSLYDDEVDDVVVRSRHVESEFRSTFRVRPCKGTMCGGINTLSSSTFRLVDCESYVMLCNHRIQG